MSETISDVVLRVARRQRGLAALVVPPSGGLADDRDDFQPLPAETGTTNGAAGDARPVEPERTGEGAATRNDPVRHGVRSDTDPLVVPPSGGFAEIPENFQRLPAEAGTTNATDAGSVRHDGAEFVSIEPQFEEPDGGWVERSEAHRATDPSSRWASHGSTHHTSLLPDPINADAGSVRHGDIGFDSQSRALQPVSQDNRQPVGDRETGRAVETINESGRRLEDAIGDLERAMMRLFNTQIEALARLRERAEDHERRWIEQANARRAGR